MSAASHWRGRDGVQHRAVKASIALCLALCTGVAHAADPPPPASPPVPPPVAATPDRLAPLRAALNDLRTPLEIWKKQGQQVQGEAEKRLEDAPAEADTSALQSLVQRSKAVVDRSRGYLERVTLAEQRLSQVAALSYPEQAVREEVAQLAAEVDRAKDLFQPPAATPAPTPQVTAQVAKTRETVFPVKATPTPPTPTPPPPTPKSAKAATDELNARKSRLRESLKQLEVVVQGSALDQTAGSAAAVNELQELQKAVDAATDMPSLERVSAQISARLDAFELARLTPPAALTTAADAAVVVAKPSPAAPSPATTSGADVSLDSGGTIAYGLTVSLLRFSTSRQPNEPARLRNYTPALELLPAEFGFQFVYRPPTRPWRLRRKGNGAFQLMSTGGILLARVDNQHFERGGLSLAATLGFFEDAIGFGAGVDLYRGIAVQGTDGTASGGTAYTGLLAWGLARQGEVTPENVFVLVSLNLASLASRVTGEAK